jgi:hypothetical protein
MVEWENNHFRVVVFGVAHIMVQNFSHRAVISNFCNPTLFFHHEFFLHLTRKCRSRIC